MNIICSRAHSQQKKKKASAEIHASITWICSVLTMWKWEFSCLAQKVGILFVFMFFLFSIFPVFIFFQRNWRVNEWPKTFKAKSALKQCTSQQQFNRLGKCDPLYRRKYTARSPKTRWAKPFTAAAGVRHIHGSLPCLLHTARCPPKTTAPLCCGLHTEKAASTEAWSITFNN